jgi:hypothetical protein
MNTLLQTLSSTYLAFALGITITTTGLLETYASAPIIAGACIAIAAILAIIGALA